jgi:hypothetical protein
MSRRQLKTDDEAGFLIAVCDDLAESEALFGVQIEMVVLRTRVRGQLNINCYAYKTPRKPADEPYATSTTPYPSASALRLHAALYRAAIRIGGELSNKAKWGEVKDSSAT